MAHAAELDAHEADPMDYSAEEDFAVFISNSEVEVTQHLLRTFQIDLASVAGLSQEELDALYARGMEMLRMGLYQQALSTFYALVCLKRFESRYYRAVALTYHYQKRFGWARIIYGQALAFDENDVISMCLRAECTLLVTSKEDAVQELQVALACKPRDRHDLPYLERAQALFNKLHVYWEGK